MHVPLLRKTLVWLIEDAGCLGHYQAVLVRTSKSKNPYYGKNGEFTDTWSLDQVIFGWVVCVTAFLYVVYKFGLMEGLTVNHLTRKSSNMTCLCGTGNAKNSWNMCSQISLSWRAMAWPSTAFGWRSWRAAPLAVQTCQEYPCATLAWRILLPLPPDTHTHKFVGICMLPFNVLKCVGSGTSINPVWIKKDVFRIKHHRLRIKTILLVVVFRVQSPPRPPGPTMWFWFSWVFWSIVFFEAPASPNLMAKTQFWHRTKYVRSTAKYSKMISKVLSDPAPIFRCLRRLLTTWRTKLTHQHLPKSLGPRWWSCPSWFVPLTRSLESKVALLVIFVSFEVADEFSFPIPNQLKGWQGKS